MFESVAAEVAAATSPQSDVHASGEYRRRLVRVLARRALTEALATAEGRVWAHDPQQVTLQVNGVAHELSVAPDATLLDVLHDQLGMKDVRYGCAEGVCGTCTVLLEGQAVSSCLMYAVQVEFRDILTVAGLLGEDESLHPLQETFLRLGGTQCGFCTPGVILTAYSLAQARSAADARGDPLRARRQHLPLYRLHQDHRSDRGLSRRPPRPQPRGPELSDTTFLTARESSSRKPRPQPTLDRRWPSPRDRAARPEPSRSSHR